MGKVVAGFEPSTKAPLFANGPWPPGTAFTVSVPGLPPVSVNTTQMGFCGGMAFLARDIFESDMPQLRGRVAADIPQPLAQLILRRLIDSFDGPATVAKWVAFTQKLDHDTVLAGPGAFHLTVEECPAIMANIDAGILCPIGVVLTQSLAPWAVFQNHVELVYGYDLDGAQLTLHVYDCNNPGSDTIAVSLDVSSPAPAKVISTNGTAGPRPNQIRGFFRLPYTHADPSAAYIDDAVVAISALPPAQMTPRSQATVEVTATNTGSTSWTPGQDYRLGSQAPQDNTTWGTGRVSLPVSQVDPQQQAGFQFQITAPLADGHDQFCWQMLREDVHWFGTPNASIPIAVGADTPLCRQLHEQYLTLQAQYNDIETEIADIDWSDPQVARIEAAALSRQAQAIQLQIATLENQQSANGCPPG